MKRRIVVVIFVLIFATASWSAYDFYVLNKNEQAMFNTCFSKSSEVEEIST